MAWSSEAEVRTVPPYRFLIVFRQQGALTMAFCVRDRCGVCCRRMTQCGTWSFAREIPAGVMATSPTSVNVDSFTFSKCLSSTSSGSASGPGGCTYEMLKVCLGDTEATHLLFHAPEELARAKAPEPVTRAFMTATVTALRKPDGGARGIEKGTSCRRQVTKTLARQFGKVAEAVCATFQFAVSTRGGTDFVGYAMRAMSDADQSAQSCRSTASERTITFFRVPVWGSCTMCPNFKVCCCLCGRLTQDAEGWLNVALGRLLVRFLLGWWRPAPHLSTWTLSRSQSVSPVHRRAALLGLAGALTKCWKCAWATRRRPICCFMHPRNSPGRKHPNLSPELSWLPPWQL